MVSQTRLPAALASALKIRRSIGDQVSNLCFLATLLCKPLEVFFDLVRFLPNFSSFLTQASSCLVSIVTYLRLKVKYYFSFG